MSGASGGSGTSHQGLTGHHQTFYGSYTNEGYHASEGGIIHINQMDYQFNLPDPLETLERGSVFDGSAPVSSNLTYQRSLTQHKRRLTDLGVDPNPSKRQRAGSFLNMTFNIAEDSADFGNPLKAALAGVRALVEQYEESQEVRKKTKALQTQLDRLGQIIATTTINGDPKEVMRRTELISALGAVETESLKLLGKGRDTCSEEVAILIEQFREAITCYQISQQQALYNRITDLASSFDTNLRLQEKSPAVKNKLDSVMARLDRLCLAGPSDDDDGHGRWSKLFTTLGPIRDSGNTLYNLINAPAYKEPIDGVQAVSGFAEDIRHALLDYQTSRQQALYDQNCKLIKSMDLVVLNNCRRAQEAGHRHGNRRGCLRGTRESVLNEIESWTEDFNKSPVFWLNGLAGTGKSTIAQTIAERAFADGLLGASFFCSRDVEDRSELRFIFPTLAFQLAHKYPAFREYLVPFLQTNPDVVYESLFSQMESLIVEPLRLTEISTVIILDALDECKDDEPSSAILSVLGRFVGQISRVKFFITGRPVPRIKSGFRLPLLEDATKVFVLHDVHPDLINSDILLFLNRAAGLFVYAVATIKFLDSENHLPDQRLEVIVRRPECTTPEGKTRFKPETTLDSLYMLVLQMAFSEKDFEVDSNVRSIIGAVVLLVNPLPPSAIAELIHLQPPLVMKLLTKLQSLLILDEDPAQPVKSFHKSFPDFVTDPSRCIDTRFYTFPGNVHLQLAISCLTVLDGLKQNFLNLPDYALNAEIEDLQTRINKDISVALRYACQSWHYHLSRSKGNVTDVISLLRIFLEDKFLAWLEVLSVLKVTRGGVVALERLVVWLQEVAMDNQLLDIARDYLYFLTEFFEPINVSATHLYHSALELSPLSSIVRKLHHHRRLTTSPSVEVGIPDSRKSSISISCEISHTEPATWSPCGQYVAALAGKGVEIRDALTFDLVSTLITSSVNRPSYSPDGRSLACVTTDGIIVWDIQTGGVVKRMQCNSRCEQLVWSPDEAVIGILSGETVIIYNVASGMALSSVRLDSGRDPYLWANNGSFRIMTTARSKKTILVNIFEVWPTPTRVESFSVQLEEGSYSWSFSSTTYRLSAYSEQRVQLVILDIQDSERLLVEKQYLSPNSPVFSPDGSRFAAGRPGTITIWSYDDDHYIRYREFQLLGCYLRHRILFSPTSSSILVPFDKSLRIWNLDDPPIARTDRRHLDMFSRSGTHFATAHYAESTITITNILSQTSCQFDTDIQIAGLGLTDNVLLVQGQGVVVAWLLTDEGFVSNVSGNRRAARRGIWTMSTPRRFRPKFSVEGETGVIKYGKTLHMYNSTTGDILDSSQKVPPFGGLWYSFSDNLQAKHVSAQNTPPMYKWKPSDTTWEKGWLKDPKGKCLLWLPMDWRVEWRRNIEWASDVSRIKFTSQDQKPVIIKLY